MAMIVVAARGSVMSKHYRRALTLHKRGSVSPIGFRCRSSGPMHVWQQSVEQGETQQAPDTFLRSLECNSLVLLSICHPCTMALQHCFKPYRLYGKPEVAIFRTTWRRAHSVFNWPG